MKLILPYVLGCAQTHSDLCIPPVFRNDQVILGGVYSVKKYFSANQTEMPIIDEN